MTKILLFLLLASILTFGTALVWQGQAAFNNLFSRSICDKPLEYRIGGVDERFNLSEDQLVARIGEAERIWEGATGRDLFTYNSTATLTINMIYDKRQSLQTQISQLENQLQSGRGDFEAKKAEYESLVANFEARLAEFNREVESWNSQGGAPPEEYDRLIKTEEELRAEAARLNDLANELNLTAAEYNSQLGKLNRNIVEFNENLRRKPEEGLFDGETNTIEIYFVVSEKELVHTIAHELGHALGLSHLENSPNSIMFPFSTEVVVASSDDNGAASLLCREKGLVQVIVENLLNLIQRIQQGSTLKFD